MLAIATLEENPTLPLTYNTEGSSWSWEPQQQWGSQTGASESRTKAKWQNQPGSCPSHASPRSPCLCQHLGKESLRSTLRPYNLKDRLLGKGSDVSETIKGLRRDGGYIVHTFSTVLPLGWGPEKHLLYLSPPTVLYSAVVLKARGCRKWPGRGDGSRSSTMCLNTASIWPTVTRAHLLLLGIMRGTHHFHRNGVGHRR